MIYFCEQSQQLDQPVLSKEEKRDVTIATRNFVKSLFLDKQTIYSLVVLPMGLVTFSNKKLMVKRCSDTSFLVDLHEFESPKMGINRVESIMEHEIIVIVSEPKGKNTAVVVNSEFLRSRQLSNLEKRACELRRLCFNSTSDYSHFSSLFFSTYGKREVNAWSQTFDLLDHKSRVQFDDLLTYHSSTVEDFQITRDLHNRIGAPAVVEYVKWLNLLDSNYLTGVFAKQMESLDIAFISREANAQRYNKAMADAVKITKIEPIADEILVIVKKKERNATLIVRATIDGIVIFFKKTSKK